MDIITLLNSLRVLACHGVGHKMLSSRSYSFTEQTIQETKRKRITTASQIWLVGRSLLRIWREKT